MHRQAHANRLSSWQLTALCLLLVSAATPSLTADQPIRVAFIGSSSDSSHFAPVYAGVLAVAKEPPAPGQRALEVIDWTPAEPLAALQADALRRAFVEGLDGVILSPVDGETLAPVIDFLTQRGIAVVTVNGDAASLDQTAHSGTSPAAIGQRLADEVILAMGQRPGPVAILGGNPLSPRNAQLLSAATARLNAANIRIHGIFNSNEDAAALDVVRQVDSADRDRAIHGWIFLGSWPLTSGEAMPWLPRQIPAVAADVIPIALSYINNRQLSALVAEDYLFSGQQAARMVVQKINGTTAESSPADSDAIWIITPDNISEHRQKWVRWMQ